VSVEAAVLKSIRRTYSTLEFKEFDDSKREFEGIATSISEDRYGDIVETDGAQFALPLPLLWQHISSQPVGHVTSATPTKKNIKVKGSIAKTDVPGSLKDRLDEAWQSLKLGLVRHLSIGFRPLKMEPIPESEQYGWRFLLWEWLELSLVTIPANADASITNLKRYDMELLRAASGRKHANIHGVPLVKVDGLGVSRTSVKLVTGQRRAVTLDTK
jgi:HK97 family phage prohead protease